MTAAAASVAPAARADQVRRADLVTLAVVTLHYAIVFAPIYVVAALGPGWSTVACWLWFGILSQGALLVLHEAAHKLLFADVRRNELVAHWVLAPLILADFAAFRQRHWDHHRQLGEPGDPKYTYRIDISGWRLLRLVVSCLTMAQAFQRVTYQSGEQSGATAESTRQAIAAVLIVQPLLGLSLLGVSWLTHRGDWWGTLVAAGTAYGAVYLYGLASLSVLMHALRGIAEHRPSDPAEPRTHDAALRNFSDGFVLGWAFAPYGFVQHATHHRFPAIPYYRLPDATRLRRASRPSSRPSAAMSPYCAVWSRLVADDTPEIFSAVLAATSRSGG